AASRIFFRQVDASDLQAGIVEPACPIGRLACEEQPVGLADEIDEAARPFATGVLMDNQGRQIEARVREKFVEEPQLPILEAHIVADEHADAKRRPRLGSCRSGAGMSVSRQTHLPCSADAIGWMPSCLCRRW